jgi:hypothetical protein
MVSAAHYLHYNLSLEKNESVEINCDIYFLLDNGKAIKEYLEKMGIKVTMKLPKQTTFYSR